MSARERTVYIAAPFDRWAEAAGVRSYLATHQIDCSARWIDDGAALGGVETNAGLVDWDAVGARNDDDVLRSCAVVSLVFDSGREQFEECGFARGNGIPVIYVAHGGTLHLSTRRSVNRLVSDWGSLIVELAKVREMARKAA